MDSAIELTNTIFLSIIGTLVWIALGVGIFYLAEIYTYYYLLLLPYFWVTIYFFTKLTGADMII